MFGKIFLCVTTLLMIGCADPTYVNDGASGRPTNGKLGAECSGQFKSGVCIFVKWIKKPTEKERGEFSFRAFRIDEEDGFAVPVDLPLPPEVLLWMPSMGHGSSPVTVTRAKGGSYRATDVFFIMPGEWQIKFQLKEDKVLSDEAVLNYVF